MVVCCFGRAALSREIGFGSDDIRITVHGASDDDELEEEKRQETTVRCRPQRN